MKQKLFFLYAVGLAIVCGGILFHAPLTVWLGTLFPEHALFIKSWKEIALSVLFVLGLALVTAYKLWAELRRDMLFWLIAVYAALHGLMALFFQPPLAALSTGLATDLRYLLVFCLLYWAVKMNPVWRRRFLSVIFGTSILSLLFAVLQIFILPRDILAAIGYSKATIAPYLTVDNNPAYVRINGTFRGPNPLGAFGVVMVSALVGRCLRYWHIFTNQWYRPLVIGLIAASLCVVYASYARSALVATVIAVGLVVMLSIDRKYARRLLALLVGIIAAATLTIFLARDTSFVQHVILHEDPQGTSQLSSNEGHVESLRDGLDRLSRQPLGAGPGSTGSASLFTERPLIIENQYLFVAHEVGWLGLGLFLVIFAIIILRLARQRHDWLALSTCASGIGLAAIGLLLPVWADDTVGIVWWALAAIALASAAGGQGGTAATN